MLTLPPSCADCLEIWESKPPGTLRDCHRQAWGLFKPYLTINNHKTKQKALSHKVYLIKSRFLHNILFCNSISTISNPPSCPLNCIWSFKFHKTCPHHLQRNPIDRPYSEEIIRVLQDVLHLHIRTVYIPQSYSRLLAEKDAFPSPLFVYGSQFLAAFAKFREGTISFVISVRPSVCPHGTTRLLLGGFSWNLIFEDFSKICWENWSFFNPLNAELNPICHLLALLGGATIVDVSRLRVKDVFHNCTAFNPLNAELNSICHLLALLGSATIVVVSRLRVNCVPISSDSSC